MRRTHATHDNHDMSHVMARLPYLPPVSIPPKGRGLFHLELRHFEHVASRSEHGTDTGPWYFMVLECFGNVWQCNYVVFFVKLHVGILSSLVLHAFMAMACVCYRLSAYLVAGAFTPSQSETQCRHLGPASSCTHFTLTQYACSVCKPSSALSCFWKASYAYVQAFASPILTFSKEGIFRGVNVWTVAFCISPVQVCCRDLAAFQKNTKVDVGHPTLSSFDWCWWLKFAEPVFSLTGQHITGAPHPHNYWYHPYRIWMYLTAFGVFRRQPWKELSCKLQTALAQAQQEHGFCVKHGKTWCLWITQFFV